MAQVNITIVRIPQPGNPRKRKTETHHLLPKKTYGTRATNGSDIVTINGAITSILYPLNAKNYEGFSVVRVNQYVIVGVFPILELFFVYNMECILNKEKDDGSYKLVNFLDPPFTPVKLTTMVIKKMMRVNLGFNDEDITLKMNALREFLKKNKIQLSDIDPAWLASNYKEKWMEKIKQRSFLFNYGDVVNLAQIWSVRSLKRLSLDDLKELVKEVKKNPVNFCFAWCNNFPTLPTLSYEKLKKAIAIFGADVNQETTGAIFKLKYQLEPVRKKKKMICFPLKKIVKRVDLPYCLKHKIVVKAWVDPLQDVRFFLKGDMRAMKECARLLGRVLIQEPDVVARTANIKKAIMKNGKAVSMNVEQEKAFNALRKHNLLVIEGEPGTGKSLTTEFIYRSFKRGTTIGVAFYGRIASDMSKKLLSGNKRGGVGMTIHKLVAEIRRNTAKGKKLQENTRVVIVDELSLITLDLFRDILTCLPNLSKIIMVGDLGQMPPPTPGGIMRDIIKKYTGTGIVHNLVQILRVEPKLTKLLNNFRNIRNGKHNLKYAENLDADHPFIILQRTHIHEKYNAAYVPAKGEAMRNKEEDKKKKRIEILKKDFIPILKMYPTMENIRIMTQKNTTRKDIAAAIFDIKKTELEGEFKPGVFCTGEKIMFLENDYGFKDEKEWLRSDEVWNGEIVTIKDICYVNPGSKQNAEGEDLVEKVTVLSTKDNPDYKTWDKIIYLTDDRQINLSHYPIDNIDKGSVSTISSNQGGEEDIVLVYIHDRFTKTLTKEEFYTAVTRAKKKVIVICDKGSKEDLSESDIARIVKNPCKHPESVFYNWLPDPPQRS